MKYYKIAVCLMMCLLNSSAFAVKYDYDGLHRLTRVTYDNGRQISYAYDEVGNRIQRVSTLMADASIDGKVDFQDFAILASRWLEEGCTTPDWCQGADINWSTAINIQDLAVLANQWLVGFD